MDTRFLELAAQCLEVSLADATRESPKAQGEGQLSTKGKNDNERKRDRRSLLWSIIACLSMDRDHSKGEPEEPVKIVPDLKQQESMDAARSKLPHGMACGIERLESEVARLRSEIAQLEARKLAECEAILASIRNNGKENKLKDANENAKDTKQVADGEENEAEEGKEATQPHLPSHHNMKEENAETPATIQKQKKLKDILSAKLKVKQYGAPHVRDAAADANNTAAAISDRAEDRRADVYLIMAELDKFRGIC